ncbi:5-(carboxyamino)imidazole ribonucleotide synthase [Natronomonas sp. EA1]|uniref:5-(carboxyamino)imidazole ribonucleotide synthase n=1 Tax=Natronomonas sp. EA1 TaxID=3421655 RepID=UPI003EBBBBD3
MELTTPGPTLGVVGGGQLGRMLGEAAGPLGVSVICSDPTPDPPAATVVADTIEGEFDDYDTLLALAERADVLTYEIELADPDTLERVSEETGTPVHPDPGTLRTIQDKLHQNQAFAEAGIPLPEFRQVDSAKDLHAAGEELGWPVMVKARSGGYDGRGNTPCSGPDDVERALSEIAGPALVEEMVPFERELAVIGVRGADGTEAFPVTETVHEEEILRELVCPARTSDAVRERAHEVALDVLDELDGRGVYGIELFEVSEALASDASGEGTDPRAEDEILVNEVAPRPHNSGHWTIEGAVTSQFEQHVRATMGFPLGSVEQRDPSVTSNILGDVDEPEIARLKNAETILETPRAHLHWYGKREVRPLRKMGHVTLTGDDAVDLLAEARALRKGLTFR